MTLVDLLAVMDSNQPVEIYEDDYREEWNTFNGDLELVPIMYAAWRIKEIFPDGKIMKILIELEED